MAAPVSRKRTAETLSPDPQGGNGPTNKRAKPLGPSDSFADVLKDMAPNDVSLSNPPPVAVDMKKALIFQQVNVQQHGDIVLVFGRTIDGARVLVHVTNLQTLPQDTRRSAAQIFLCRYKVNAMNWMELPQGKFRGVAAGSTLSHNQEEVIIKHEDIVFHPEIQRALPLATLSFDIETRVRDDEVFTPFHRTAEMPVLQISSIIQFGTRSYRTIFTLGGCAPISGVQIRAFRHEASMLLAWKEFVVTSDPDLVVGHNIARYDFIYLLLRAEVLRLSDFACLGRLKGLKATALKVRPGAFRTWKDAPVLAGRLQLDLYQYIQEKYSREGVLDKRYTLDAISEEFLGLTKENIKFDEINSLQDSDDNDRRSMAT
ncbi:ribonuclease H-like domain-containing protein [Mycena belliarum]|uniref:DNA polymerase delta catalytic subunit n=1 Tax=Mycena belliarum TaxID=1033014 RepID=A0AAD6TU28_9AGAR|nr:ribonuclease H-like domain-containing protein [Mycena belliae]